MVSPRRATQGTRCLLSQNGYGPPSLRNGMTVFFFFFFFLLRHDCRGSCAATAWAASPASSGGLLPPVAPPMTSTRSRLPAWQALSSH
mmetsp:Transcript_4769/g.3770  ORF Transcript_4769/g.3770 Transcript_4769/m.3770 type:complete len:88 (+) Transcript_4769:86-349(+)